MKQKILFLEWEIGLRKYMQIKRNLNAQQLSKLWYFQIMKQYIAIKNGAKGPMEPNRNSIKRSTPDKMQWGKYNIFNKWCCFSQISLKEKVNLNPNHRPYNKTIPDKFRQNVRGKTIKLMEKNIGEYLHDLKEKEILLEELKMQIIKEEPDKLRYIKI